MKKFIFRLETLLRLRKVREGSLKRDLELAHQKWNQTKESETTLQTQIGALMDEMRSKREEGRYDLQETYTHILDHLNESLTSVQQSLLYHLKSIEEQQERLKLAVQGRKLIEKIKEKQYTQWRYSEIQTEGALLDEISGNKQAQLK